MQRWHSQPAPPPCAYGGGSIAPTLAPQCRGHESSAPAAGPPTAGPASQQHDALQCHHCTSAAALRAAEVSVRGGGLLVNTPACQESVELIAGSTPLCTLRRAQARRPGGPPASGEGVWRSAGGCSRQGRAVCEGAGAWPRARVAAPRLLHGRHDRIGARPHPCSAAGCAQGRGAGAFPLCNGALVGVLLAHARGAPRCTHQFSAQAGGLALGGGPLGPLATSRPHRTWHTSSIQACQSLPRRRARPGPARACRRTTGPALARATWPHAP